MTNCDGEPMAGAIEEAVCPLCGRRTPAAVLSMTPYSSIWENLSREWGARFSQAVIDKHTLSVSVRLLSCTECGLEHFAPSMPGSIAFYSELTSSSPNYYSKDKWEFGYVRRLLKPTDKVLDVACGKGAFLLSIAGVVDEVLGLDTNPDVFNEAGVGEVRILNQSVEVCARSRAANFDVVTAFQVVEHLNEVMPFVRAAFACVKPGGVLVLSAPNRDRRRDQAFGSLDYPPHHLSRWSGTQLEVVARLLGGKIVAIAREPMTRSQVIGALRMEELPKMIPWQFPGRYFVIKVVSRLLLSFPLAFAWKTLGMSDRLGMYGMSILAVISKPLEKSEELPDRARA